MSLARCLPVVFVLVFGAAAATPRVDVTGEYTSNWDDVRLVQEGTRVEGTYVCCGGGTIEGRIIEGRVIKFHWHEPRGAGDGEGIWKITADGRLTGTWGRGQSNNDGGPWNLALKAQTARIAQ
jgi:hypothetical protein